MTRGIYSSRRGLCTHVLKAAPDGSRNGSSTDARNSLPVAISQTALQIETAENLLLQHLKSVASSRYRTGVPDSITQIVGSCRHSLPVVPWNEATCVLCLHSCHTLTYTSCIHIVMYIWVSAASTKSPYARPCHSLAYLFAVASQLSRKRTRLRQHQRCPQAVEPLTVRLSWSRWGSPRIVLCLPMTL